MVEKIRRISLGKGQTAGDVERDVGSSRLGIVRSLDSPEKRGLLIRTGKRQTGVGREKRKCLRRGREDQSGTSEILVKTYDDNEKSAGEVSVRVGEKKS